MPTVEVLRPARQVRQMRGKSDQIDACAAAHTALADVYTLTAKTSTGIVEAIRVTSTARRSGVKARAEVRPFCGDHFAFGRVVRWLKKRHPKWLLRSGHARPGRESSL